MNHRITGISALALTLLLSLAAYPQNKAEKESTLIPPGSKVYIAPMEGFETHLKAAFTKKDVPLVIVEEKEKADFEITGTASSQKASAAKKIIMGSWRSREEATIKVTNLKSGVIVFGYSVHKENSAHGQKSTAEACAKHLKEKVAKNK